ncbi:MAG: hypothetical protein JO288_04925 [Hyphomicrobiales bacterium]|nr:hypothetical protein [Hyphomicrobiales bacterium]
MEPYPVDIDAGQIVRWFLAEREGPPSRFRFAAWLSRETEALPRRAEFRLGDDEREDLNEVLTVATLEIAPAHVSDGWRLLVVVEDEAGPRISDRERHAVAEHAIDLPAFYRDFIRPGRGSADVTAEAEDPAAQERLSALLDAIEEDRHDFHRSAPAR